MLRTILVVISLGLFFIFSCILFPIELIVGKISPQARVHSQFRIAQGYCHILKALAGVKLTVKGQENIPKADEAVLYIVNHRSFYDVVLTFIMMPAPACYIAKKEFGRVPLLSWWISWTGALYLDRDNIKDGLRTILTAIDRVKNGTSVVIFPEGTRNRNKDERDMLPFHEGSFKVATKSGCRIVPVTISGSSRILEDHFPIFRSVPVIMEFGKPIETKGLSREETKGIGRKVQDIMEETMNRNHEEAIQ